VAPAGRCPARTADEHDTHARRVCPRVQRRLDPRREGHPPVTQLQHRTAGAVVLQPAEPLGDRAGERLGLVGEPWRQGLAERGSSSSTWSTAWRSSLCHL